VQSNAATAEESSAASEELSTQATLLNNEVKKFKLKEREYRMNDPYASSQEFRHSVSQTDPSDKY
ncbi:MAG: methyl-accepting chemotaxis protein, partial [Peptostreptococcaceae bacterium]|nr:methyl-accepting chemotaxis protein [Peptostreptococcaceae bacterium]